MSALVFILSHPAARGRETAEKIVAREPQPVHLVGDKGAELLAPPREAANRSVRLGFEFFPLLDLLEARVAGEWEADPDVQRVRPVRARQRPTARDRVASYAALKDGRDRERREADARAGGRTHRAQRGAPSSGDPGPPLLARLQEAQQRLNEIQGAVDAMRPASNPRAPPAGRGRRDHGPPPPAPPVVPAAVEPVPELAEPGAARCLGGDAFGRAPVARWEPPETARLEQIQQWKKLKAQSDAAIRGFARGGQGAPRLCLRPGGPAAARAPQSFLRSRARPRGGGLGRCSVD